MLIPVHTVRKKNWPNRLKQRNLTSRVGFRANLWLVLSSASLMSISGCQTSQGVDLGATRHSPIALSKLQKEQTHGGLPKGPVDRDQATAHAQAFERRFQQPSFQQSGGGAYPNTAQTGHPEHTQQIGQTGQPVVWDQHGNPVQQVQGQMGQMGHQRHDGHLGPTQNTPGQYAENQFVTQHHMGHPNQPQPRQASHPSYQGSLNHPQPASPVSRQYEVMNQTNSGPMAADWHQPLDDAMRQQWRKMTNSQQAAAERLLAATFSLRPLTGDRHQRDENLVKMMTALRQELARGNQLSPELIKAIGEQTVGKSAFRIRRAEICKRVRSYGVYDPFESLTFMSGQNQPMIIYAELDDFHVQDKQNQMKEVLLEQSVAIYNEVDGLKVWEEKPVQIKDQSRNQRRDFYVVQKVVLPASLGVGRYRMKVTIQDIHGRQFDEISIPIARVTQPNLTHDGVSSQVRAGMAPTLPNLPFNGNLDSNLRQNRPANTRVLPLGYSAMSLGDQSQ